MQTMSAVGRKATLAGIPERSRAGWAALPFSLSPTEPWTAGPSLPPGAERTQAFSEVGLGVSVGLRVCMWQTQRQPCWDCAVWTARVQHHLGGPAFTVSLGCKACPLHTASLFPWLLQGELMWGPAKGTSTRWGARPEHCLPRMGPAVPCPCTPGLGTPPPGSHRRQPKCQCTRGTPFLHPLLWAPSHGEALCHRLAPANIFKATWRHSFPTGPGSPEASVLCPLPRTPCPHCRPSLC